MVNMKSLSLTVQKLWPKLKFFGHKVTDRQDKKEFHSGGQKNGLSLLSISQKFTISRLLGNLSFNVV